MKCFKSGSQKLRESFAKVTVVFAKDYDRKAPRKAGESFAKCFGERLDDRKAGEKFAKDNFIFFEEWSFCLERIWIKTQMFHFFVPGNKAYYLQGVNWRTAV